MPSPEGCSGRSSALLWKASPDGGPNCWRVTYRRQCKKRTGTGRGKKGEKSTVMLLPRHSFAPPIYSKSGSMIYCKLKKQSDNFSQIGSKQSSPR